MAAINKNFVIKNGIEVGDNLIYGDKTNLKVGIGTTVPNYTLDVRGGIGATSVSVGQTITANSGIFTSFNVSGVGTITTLNATGVTATVVSSTWSQVGLGLTFTTGIGTNLTVSGVGTITTLNATGVAATVVSSTWSQVGAGLTFTTGIATNFTVSGVGTITTLNATGVAATAIRSTWSQVGLGLTFTTGIGTFISITGVGTIANLSSGIATVTKIHVGIATTYSETLVVSGNARVTGILTIGTGSITLNGNTDIITVGTGATIFSSGDVRLAGIITAYKFVGDGSALTGTINGIGIQSGGSNVSFGITTLNFTGATIQSITGDSNLGISTITIQAGVPTPAGSNTQIQFNDAGVVGASANLTFDGSNVRVSGALTATAVSSTWSQVGLGLTFTTGIATNFTVSGVGTIANLSSGIATVTKIHVGIATTYSETLVVSGNARVTGILTIGTGSITLNGNTDIITVGTGLTLSSSGIVAGIITAYKFVGDGSGLTGAGIGSAGNVNTSGIITASAVSANEFIGTGDKLIFSPTITSFSPTDGATGVSALSSPNIILTYSQPIGFGTTGAITLRTVSAAGTITESFSVGVSTRATISNQTLTIDPTSNLDYNQDYHVVVPSGTITNYVGGIASSLSNYNFTTEAGPTLSSVSPGIGSTNVSLSTNVVFTFNKNVRAGVGTITLRTVSAEGTIVESYDVSSSNRLTFSTSTLTIDPTSNLGIGVTHFVVVPNNAVAGYTGINTYSFTTLGLTFSSINPANAATNIAVSTNIALTFTSAPTRGTGTITLRSGSTSGSVIETFDAASSGRISISGNDYIINPTSDLAFSTSIHTIIPSTAIVGYVGLNTAGANTHSFTTIALNLGDSYEGGFLICKASPLRWVVSPRSAEVSRDWYSRDDANTRAQQVSGCTGWFVPTRPQLQNPGYLCRSFWDSYSSARYWSGTESESHRGCFMNFSFGHAGHLNKAQGWCVRAFRCVTY